MCGRFRAFREMLQIPRAAFAVSVGFGTERIASYEAARAPLKYEVFRAASSRYFLNPQWLAAAVGSPKLWGPFDDSPFANQIPPRALFTEVYDEFIVEELARGQQELANLEKRHRSPSEPIKLELLDYCVKLEALAIRIRNALNARIDRPELSALGKNILLTGFAASGKLPRVKSQLKDLLARANRLTSVPGAKTALADSLGVPLTSLSRWLSGERGPGGETTLRLLAWVQAQEAKLKSPGCAPAQPGQKTQVRKSTTYEKANSSPPKR